MCVRLIQISLSLLVMEAFWLPMDAKLSPDYWILMFSGCICDIVTVVTPEKVL